jgi:hypothetical protein
LSEILREKNFSTGNLTIFASALVFLKIYPGNISENTQRSFNPKSNF